MKLQRTSPRQGGRLSVERRRMRMGYIFCLPLIFGLLLLFIPNMIQTITFTLNDFDIDPTGNGYALSSVGIRNYVKALTENPQFLIHLKNSLQSIFINLPIVVIFSLFMAVVLNQKFKGQLVSRVIFFIPVLLATGVVASVENSSNLLGMVADNSIDTGTTVDWSQMSGLRDILLSLNFSDTLISIVATAANSIYEIVQISGIQIFILLAGLQEISPSLYEAAKVEGCDGWSLFWKITFPMISPQLVVCGVYTVVDSYSSVSNTLAAYTNSVAFSTNQYGYATAMNFIYFVIIGIILAILSVIISRFVHYNDV